MYAPVPVAENDLALQKSDNLMNPPVGFGVHETYNALLPVRMLIEKGSIPFHFEPENNHEFSGNLRDRRFSFGQR